MKNMKKVFLFLAMTALFCSCNHTPKKSDIFYNEIYYKGVLYVQICQYVDDELVVLETFDYQGKID